MMRISVLIPTYRRPTDLRRCLDALGAQSRQPDQVVVSRRINDDLSAAEIERARECLGDRIVDATVGPNDNLIKSMNGGLRHATGDLIALTDDDTEPPADWLLRLSTAFDDPNVGAVGGRDIQASNPGEAAVVGRLQWFGRIIGNHHLGIGPPRDVDVLKGANFCVRGNLLRSIGFDSRLRGAGNVSHWELALSFAILRRGYRLVYDPSVVLVHHIADRHDGDTNNRGGFNGPALRDSVHNETLSVLEHLPPVRRFAYLSWAHLVGTGDCPGIAQFPRVLMDSRSVSRTIARLHHTQRGRLFGTRSFLSGFNSPRNRSRAQAELDHAT